MSDGAAEMFTGALMRANENYQAENAGLLRLAGELVGALEPFAEGAESADELNRPDTWTFHSFWMKGAWQKLNMGQLRVARAVLSSIPPDLMSKIEEARGA